MKQPLYRVYPLRGVLDFLPVGAWLWTVQACGCVCPLPPHAADRAVAAMPMSTGEPAEGAKHEVVFAERINQEILGFTSG